MSKRVTIAFGDYSLGLSFRDYFNHLVDFVCWQLILTSIGDYSIPQRDRWYVQLGFV